jgi:hypothetical protein
LLPKHFAALCGFILGNGVTVARLTLTQVVLVRIQVPQPLSYQPFS